MADVSGWKVKWEKEALFLLHYPFQKQMLPKPMHLNDLVKQLKEQMAQSSLKLNGKACYDTYCG